MRTHRSNRGFYGAGVTPAPTDASVNQSHWGFEFSRPLASSLRDVTHRKAAVITSVTTLLRSRRPFDVARFIMTVIIDAIERVFSGGFAANVIQQIFNRTKTKLNTALPISWKSNVVGIVTPRLSAPVSGIFGRDRITRTFTVLSGSRANKRISQTPTRLCVSVGEVAPVDNGFRATITDAIPKGQSFGTPGETVNSQSIKTLASQVFKSGIEWMWFNMERISFHIRSIANLMELGKQTQAIVAI